MKIYSTMPLSTTLTFWLTNGLIDVTLKGSNVEWMMTLLQADPIYEIKIGLPEWPVSEKVPVWMSQKESHLSITGEEVIHWDIK